MRMIKITPDLAVNAEFIASVRLNAESITICMAQGDAYHIGREFRKTTQDKFDEIMGMLE